MKHLYKITAVMLLSAPVSMMSFAAEPTATTGAKAPAESMQGAGGMMGGMNEEQSEQHLRAMQEYSLKVHDLSNQILAEKDPAKKEQLKNQQLELMKSHREKMMGHRQEKMQHKMQ
ncbi:MAG: hypothetical protein ACXWT3_15235 [Methylococcaceae bacterium]